MNEKDIRMSSLLKEKWYVGVSVVCLAILLAMPVYAENKIKIGVTGPMKFMQGQQFFWGTQLAKVIPEIIAELRKA